MTAPALETEAMMAERRPHGELKSRLVQMLWDAGEPLTAKALRARFESDEHVPTLQTFLTVLERLRKSGVVERELAPSGEYVFAPTRSESSEAVERMLGELMKSSDRTDVLLGFAGGLDEKDLDTLRSALRARRSTE